MFSVCKLDNLIFSVIRQNHKVYFEWKKILMRVKRIVASLGDCKTLEEIFDIFQLEYKARNLSSATIEGHSEGFKVCKHTTLA